MSRLVVDDQNQLQKISAEQRFKYPLAVKIIARLISIVFHPLFLPFYLTWFIIRIQPYLFPGLDNWNRILVLIHTFILYTLFPLVSTLLLKALGFIQSVEMKTQRDRIIPYVICGIFYFWSCYVAFNLPEHPREIVVFRLAIFLAASIALIANIYTKVSMHAIAVGVVTTFMMWFAYTQSFNFAVYLSITLLVAGLVCTSRLIVSDHSTGEIYLGLFIGIFSQLVAFPVLNLLG